MSGLDFLAIGLKAAGQFKAGKAADAAANFEADQLNMKADEERAAATRLAEQRRTEGDLMESRQIALAADSGAGVAETPTIMNLLEDTAVQSDMNARGEIYGGEQRGRGLEDSAKAKRFEGKVARQLGTLQAADTIVSGISNTAKSGFGAKYG